MHTYVCILHSSFAKEEICAFSVKYLHSLDSGDVVFKSETIYTGVADSADLACGDIKLLVALFMHNIVHYSFSKKISLLPFALNSKHILFGCGS